MPFGMPDDNELEQYDHPARPIAGNELYRDVRGAKWSDVVDVLEQDRELADRLVRTADIYEQIVKYLGERNRAEGEDARGEAYWNSVYGYLDPGIASSVLALSAAGAAPVYSCNGGIFGDKHHEAFPLVCFYASEDAGPRIARLASEAGVILEYNRISQTPVLSCLKIEPFIRFAELMVSEFRSDAASDQ